MIVGNLVGMYGIKKLLGVSESILAAIGFSCYAIENGIRAVAYEPWHLYLGKWLRKSELNSKSISSCFSHCNLNDEGNRRPDGTGRHLQNGAAERYRQDLFAHDVDRVVDTAAFGTGLHVRVPGDPALVPRGVQHHQCHRVLRVFVPYGVSIRREMRFLRFFFCFSRFLFCTL